MATTSGEVERESNQALLFRLSTALKKVDRLKSAQANVLHRMEVARRITPGRDKGISGSSRKENFFSPKQIIKGKMEKRLITKSPLQSLNVNVSAASPARHDRSSLFPASPVSKFAEHGREKELRLRVPESPLSFKEALLTPVKKEKMVHDKADIGVTWSEVTLEELSLDEVTLHESANKKERETKPKQLSFNTKQDVDIVVDSISTAAKESQDEAKPGKASDIKTSEKRLAETGLGTVSKGGVSRAKRGGGGEEEEKEEASPSVLRALKRAFRKEMQEKNLAVKAVEDMHAKMEDMHKHVQIAYKMKKVAESNLSKAVGDLQLNQMERATEVNELKKRISEMSEEHERYRVRCEQKVQKLRNALKHSQADLSGVEIHLHQYEKQVNRLQAQIELLRRNMVTSQSSRVHGIMQNPISTSHLSPLTTEGSTCSTDSYTRMRKAVKTPENYYAALQNYTPSILDALNIDMI